jgi:hypothetical protein
LQQLAGGISGGAHQGEYRTFRSAEYREMDAVQLHRHIAMKNFNVLFWTAMNFIYQDLEGLTVDLIESCVEKLSYKPSIYDVIGFCNIQTFPRRSVDLQQIEAV